MAQFEIRFKGLDSVLDMLRKAPGGMRQMQGRVLLKLAVLTEGKLKDRLDNKDVRHRSGTLLRSVGSSGIETGPGGALLARAGYGALGGPSARYARAIEEGATIRPKSGSLLAQPIGEALTAGGVPRFTSEDGHWLQKFAPGGFWFTSKAGNKLFSRKVPGGGLDPVALGRTETRITARHSAKQAQQEALAQAAGIIEFEVRRALAAA